MESGFLSPSTTATVDAVALLDALDKIFEEE
jgi:hypothetical protein